MKKAAIGVVVAATSLIPAAQAAAPAPKLGVGCTTWGDARPETGYVCALVSVGSYRWVRVPKPLLSAPQPGEAPASTSPTAAPTTALPTTTPAAPSWSTAGIPAWVAAIVRDKDNGLPDTDQVRSSLSTIAIAACVRYAANGSASEMSNRLELAGLRYPSSAASLLRTACGFSA